MKITTPLLIVFEGIDGAGKSTQATLLYAFCRELAKTALLQEPTNSKWGKSIRKILQGELQATTQQMLDLFIHDRAYDVKHNIKPLLHKGYVVIVDRYFYSTAAYQAGDGNSPHDIVRMNCEKGFPVPDRVYFVDIEPEIALTRIDMRSGNNRDIFEKLSELTRIRSNYLSIADSSFCIINGNNSKEAIFDAIQKDFIQHFSDVT
ncbi:MAG: dTMP kinase [Spirochaetes bacterium]|jgi:dTMP kinase|nr:dTMP kinase [Spirochaetota bacterium]